MKQDSRAAYAARESTSTMLAVQQLTKVHAGGRDGASGGVRGANFSVPRGSFFTLLGPSGCGKTTTLRCIAGLETPDAGTIEIEDRTVFSHDKSIDVPTNKRNIGMVFQSYAVWPHMTVAENVAFPLEVSQQRRSRRDIKEQTRGVLESVGLGGLESRSATQLSGGQQQRLALARAIIHQPSMLLLDEPLSNLDVKLRDEMRVELKRLQQQVGLTAIYVTHDQTEALAMSDAIAIMNRGEIIQIGTPKSVYDEPVNRFVASFIGTTNFLPGRVIETQEAGAAAVVRLNNGSRLLCRAARPVAVNSDVEVSIRPELIVLGKGEGQGAGDVMGVLAGVVTARIYIGSGNTYHVDVGGGNVQVTVGPDHEFAPGSSVNLRVAAKKSVVLPLG
jgi:iron(III) transport system ATP-binding protein